MLNLARLLRRVRSLFTSEKFAAELDEEMRFHLEMETERLVKAGLDENTARQRALSGFGAPAQHRDAAGDARGVRPVEDFLMDLRVGARSLAKRPTYAVVAVLTLAIGIGGTTALGSAVYRVLLAPYPFADASRIVTLWETNKNTPNSTLQVASGNFIDWRARSKSFDLMAAAEPYGFDWVGPEGPESFQTTLVTEDFFALQGLRPLHGRTFVKEEFQPGQNNVVMLTETIWRTRFGSDTSLIGKTLVLDSVPRLVVGIMSHEAMEPFGAEMWAPKVYRPDEATSRTGGYWQVVARLARGVTLEQAGSEMDGIALQLAQDYSATNKDAGISIVTLRDAIGGSVRQSLLVLFGAVAFVMIIACVNVANLQLGEAIRRRRELAIRTAIGAGQGRLIRQLLTESLMLAVIGAIAGLLIAYWAIAVIRASAPDDLWQLRRLFLDNATLVFALILACLTAMAIAVMPIAAISRIPIAESLASGWRPNAGGLIRRRAHRALVVSEVALALVLLVGAGLLLRSLGALSTTQRGFDHEGVFVTTLQAWSYYPTAAARAEFVRQAVERVGKLPGVRVVGTSSTLPLSWPIGFERGPVSIEGQPIAPGDEQRMVRLSATTPGYFTALNIPVKNGRPFSDNDRAGAAPVALVNETFARQYFPEGGAIGKRITMGYMGPPTAREIVGIVGDVRHDGLQSDPAPGVFVPHAQAPSGAIHLVVRADGDEAAVQRMVRRELTAMNGAMPLEEMTTLSAILARSLQQRQFQLGLLACFSATALLLASIGIYGVMSRATSERTQEIGLRLAVGAQPSDVRWMVLRSGGGLSVFGIGIGLIVAALLTRYMSAMLFGVEPLDVLTYMTSVGVLLTTALLATWIPAWRASTVDPVVALRAD